MNDPLAPLRARFLARAVEDLAALRAGVVERYAVHRLAGSAGMFGYHEVSRLAACVDEQLHAGETPEAEAVAALVEALDALPAPP